MTAAPLPDLARQLHNARRSAATMRKRARLYAEGGADWLAADARRRARLIARRARGLARTYRIVRTIATRGAANDA